MGAAHFGQTLAVEKLLAGGANVNLPNESVRQQYSSKYCLLMSRHLFSTWDANCKSPEYSYHTYIKLHKRYNSEVVGHCMLQCIRDQVLEQVKESLLVVLL